MSLVSLPGCRLWNVFQEAFSGVRPWQKDTYTRALKEEIHTLDPALAYDLSSWEVLSNLYEPLFQYAYLQEPQTLEPLLALDFPTKIRSHRAIEIHIKKGVHYVADEVWNQASNQDQTRGREIQAQDFITALKRAALPQLHSPGWSFLRGRILGLDDFRKGAMGKSGKELFRYLRKPVAGLQTPKPHTLRIEFTRPLPRFTHLLTLPFSAPYPIEFVEHYADARGAVHFHAPSTGPFQLHRWSRGKEIELRKNPTHHPIFYPTEVHPRFEPGKLTEDSGLRLPFLKRVLYRVIKDPLERWKQFDLGLLDSMDITSLQSTEVFDPDRPHHLRFDLVQRKVKIQTETAAELSFLVFNIKNAWAGKKIFRQLIAHTISKETLMTEFGIEASEKAVRFTPPQVPGQVGLPRMTHDYDVKKAQSLLQSADLKGLQDETLHLSMPDGHQQDRKMGAAIQKALTTLGLKVQVSYTPNLQHLRLLEEGKFQIAFLRWSLDYPRAESLFRVFAGVSSKKENSEKKVQSPLRSFRWPTGERANFGKYHEPDYGHLYDLFSNYPEGSKRHQYHIQLEQKLQADLPWLPLFYRTRYSLVQPWLKNVRNALFLRNRVKHYRIDNALKEKFFKN